MSNAVDRIRTPLAEAALAYDYPESVGGWVLTDASKAADTPGANYEYPGTERIFVNIHLPSINQEVIRAQYNPHNHPEAGYEIAKGTDVDDVVEAAIEWMENNEPHTVIGQQIRF